MFYYWLLQVDTVVLTNQQTHSLAIGRDGMKESKKSVLLTRLDDDDDDAFLEFTNMQKSI